MAEPYERGQEDEVVTSAISDRRFRLMIEVTCEILRADSELRLCEGLRLIDASRVAMGRVAPDVSDLFDDVLEPHMRRILFDRFGIPHLTGTSIN